MPKDFLDNKLRENFSIFKEHTQYIWTHKSLKEKLIVVDIHKDGKDWALYSLIKKAELKGTIGLCVDWVKYSVCYEHGGICSRFRFQFQSYGKSGYSN